MANSRNVLAVSAFAGFSVLGAGAPSSAEDFVIKGRSGRCIRVDTGDAVRAVTTGTCENKPGFLALNLSGGFAGTILGFRKVPAPPESFVCLHANLPEPGSNDPVRFPVTVVTNNCAVPPVATQWTINTSIFVANLLNGVALSICLEETPEHKIVGNNCNGSDAQKWDTTSPP